MQDLSPIDAAAEASLRALLNALIDQHAGRVIVPPLEARSGFWFGGGNIAQAPDGTLWLVGRYRVAGDSRTGVGAGERGKALALFASSDGGATFEKVREWSKTELQAYGAPVLSIEGSALRFAPDGGCELFVSMERDAAYPAEVTGFQKPGTGVWSIDVCRAESPQQLDANDMRNIPLNPAPSVEHPEAHAVDPAYLHIKDPVVFDTDAGDTVLIFCSHPFCWSSSNSGFAVRPAGAERFQLRSYEMIARGPAWDVAGTRITARMPVPRVGRFAELPPMGVFFYDGLECVRPHEQHSQAVARPRGYSCEELGGACYGRDAAFPRLTRLSRLRPMFVSPHATGCSRYVDVCSGPDGLLATWQQARPDGAQPLVGHALSWEQVGGLLSS